MSEMTSKGHEAWPPIHQDEKRLENIVNDEIWTDMMLNDRIVWYLGFIATEKTLQPRGKERSQRNVAHMKFERDCRNGKYVASLFAEDDNGTSQE